MQVLNVSNIIHTCTVYIHMYIWSWRIFSQKHDLVSLLIIIIIIIIIIMQHQWKGAKKKSERRRPSEEAIQTSFADFCLDFIYVVSLRFRVFFAVSGKVQLTNYADVSHPTEKRLRAWSVRSEAPNLKDHVDNYIQTYSTYIHTPPYSLSYLPKCQE